MDLVKLKSEKSVENELSELIDGKKELQLFLQPIVYFKKKKTFAYEVLSRGASNTILSDVSPFDYASSFGLGKKLDKVALKKIFNSLDTLPSEYIFVNAYLSNLDFLHDLVINCKTDKNIFIEIDFSTELVDIKKVLSDIEGLKKYPNIAFAVDDLGKYSLDRKLYDIISPKYLKVDICVTKGISEDVTKQKALDDIVYLSNEIGSELILEGVEYREDSNFFQTQGFEMAQGNLYQKPREVSFFRK